MSQVMKISFHRDGAVATGVSQPYAGSKSSRGKKSSGDGGKPVPKGTFLFSLETGEDCKLSIYDEANPCKTPFRKGGSRKETLLALCELLKKAAETTEEQESSTYELSEMEGHQLDDSFPGGVSFITVYRGIDMSFAYVEVTPQDLSTLVVTGAGEVFGKGWNSVHCCPFNPSMVPMKEGCGDTLEDFVKIDMFQGLKVRKIAVEEFFGVALTSDNTLYKWGCYKSAPEQVVVMLEEYRPGPCHCGRTSGGKPHRVGSAELMYCTHDKFGYKAYTTSEPPPRGIPVRKFIMHDRATFACPKCHTRSTPSLMSYGGYKLSQCSKCSRTFEAKDTKDVYVKIPIKVNSGVIDVDSTEELMWTLSTDNSLTVTKYDYTQSSVLPVKLSSEEVMRTVNCGQRHVAIVTNKGSVYCYGNRVNENPKARCREGRLNVISFWRADVPGHVEKVNCGRYSTICLVEDGSLYIIEKEGVISKVGSEYAFPTVSAKPLLDIVYKLKYPFYGKRGKEVTKNLNEFEEVMSSLTSILAGTHLEEGETPWELPAHPEPESQLQISQSDNHEDLYGKTHLSNVTLKVADGSFPAHRSVLVSSSEFFKTLLAHDSSPLTLDVTDYNPRAYRCFLKHLYRVTPDTLNLDDLLDLLDIALIYKETIVTNKVVQSLILKINPNTVAKILLRTKPLELFEACKTHIRSPEFKTNMANVLMDDPSKDLLFLPSP